MERRTLNGQGIEGRSLYCGLGVVLVVAEGIASDEFCGWLRWRIEVDGMEKFACRCTADSMKHMIDRIEDYTEGQIKCTCSVCPDRICESTVQEGSAIPGRCLFMAGQEPKWIRME